MFIRLDGAGKITGGAKLRARDGLNDDAGRLDFLGAQTDQSLVGDGRRRIGSRSIGRRSIASESGLQNDDTEKMPLQRLRSNERRANMRTGCIEIG